MTLALLFVITRDAAPHKGPSRVTFLITASPFAIKVCIKINKQRWMKAVKVLTYNQTEEKLRLQFQHISLVRLAQKLRTSLNSTVIHLCHLSLMSFMSLKR